MGKFWGLVPDSIKAQDPDGILKQFVDALEMVYDSRKDEISQIPTLTGPYDVNRGSILTDNVQAESDDKFAFAGNPVDLTHVELGQLIGVPDDLMIGVGLSPVTGAEVGNYQIIIDWDSVTGIATVTPGWVTGTSLGDLIEIAWPNFIDLPVDASSADGYYTNMWIRIAAGPGSAPVQYRQIFDYDGDIRRAYVTPNFNVPPDRTSIFELIPYNVGIQHLANQLGWIIDGDDPEPLQREQIARAVNTYKLKGTIRGFEQVFRTFGFLASIQELTSNYAKAPTLAPGIPEKPHLVYTVPPDQFIETGDGREYIKAKLAEGRNDSDDFDGSNHRGTTSIGGNAFLLKFGWQEPVFDTGHWTVTSWDFVNYLNFLYEYAAGTALERNILLRQQRAGSYTFELSVDMAYFIGNDHDDFLGGLVFHYSDHDNYYAAYYYGDGVDSGLTNFRFERVRDGIKTTLYETTAAPTLVEFDINTYGGEGGVLKTLKVEGLSRRNFRVTIAGTEIANVYDPGDQPPGLYCGVISHRNKTVPNEFMVFDNFTASYSEAGLRIPHSDIAIYIKRKYPGVELNSSVMARIRRRLEDVRPVHVNINRIAFLESPSENIGVSDYLEGTFINFPEDEIAATATLSFILFNVIKVVNELIAVGDPLEVWSPVQWGSARHTRWGKSNARYKYGQIHYRS